MTIRLYVVAATIGFAGAVWADPNPEAQRQLAMTALEQKADLDTATASRVQDVVERYRERIQTARADRQHAGRALRLALRHQRTDDVVRAVEVRLTQATDQARRAEADRLRDLRAILTPTQLGHLLMTWRKINHALRHGRV